MESFAKDFVAVLQYLLPGFVSAWVFYGLTSYAKPSQFERVVEAMIFTLFTQAIVSMVEFAATSYKLVAQWNSSIGLICSIIVALVLGMLFSYFANHDKLHNLLRVCKITHQNSYPSEWFKAFVKPTFVVLHFNDERRLYGWPIEWPSKPDEGHFLLADPAWLLDNGAEQRFVAIKHILVNIKDVKWVEFIENAWENENG